jgi:hypothetical protein
MFEVLLAMLQPPPDDDNIRFRDIEGWEKKL